jgi:hypothetical protein
MSKGSKPANIDDPYCHVCSSTGEKKRLSSYSCDHCHLYMCYDCYQKHQLNLTDEYSKLTNLFHNKKQLFATFEEHCLRNVNSTFDEMIHDLENLRKESIDYVKQQFRETEVKNSFFLSIIQSKYFSL